jgi:hypothetical protein
METKFTPGPWTVINGNELFPTVVFKDVEVPAEDIGTLNYPHPHIVVNESHNQMMDSINANAKLIAAAPDLLEALIESQKFLIEKINGTPTSNVRNKMTDLNILIESAIQKSTL